MAVGSPRVGSYACLVGACCPCGEGRGGKKLKKLVRLAINFEGDPRPSTACSTSPCAEEDEEEKLKKEDDDDDPFVDFTDAISSIEECRRTPFAAAKAVEEDEEKKLKIWEEEEERKVTH